MKKEKYTKAQKAALEKNAFVILCKIKQLNDLLEKFDLMGVSDCGVMSAMRDIQRKEVENAFHSEVVKAALGTIEDDVARRLCVTGGGVLRVGIGQVGL